MTLYDTIFARRSVRQYNTTPLDAAALNEIERYVNSITQLPGQSARFQMLDGDKIKGAIAPHAILAFSDNQDAALVNVGYTLQELDLWLQSNGYGSIWCGMAAAKEKTQDFQILLGFGKTDVPLRTSESEFKRKEIADISNDDNAIARAARIAPSAINLQPWKLTFTDGKVTIASNVRGVGRVIPGRSYLFGLGIVTKHIELALLHEGKTVTAIRTSGEGKHSIVEVHYK